MSLRTATRGNIAKRGILRCLRRRRSGRKHDVILYANDIRWCFPITLTNKMRIIGDVVAVSKATDSVQMPYLEQRSTVPLQYVLIGVALGPVGSCRNSD